MGDGLLEALKVVDLSQGIAGPLATMILADQGAQVTKVEVPGGDPYRRQSGYRVWQRGKRSAEVDLTTDKGRRVLLGLVRDADVVVDSFSPGTAAKLGLGWDVLSATNPRLIGCSITGYGTTKHQERPALDALVQARTGLFYDQKGRRGTAMSYIAGQLPAPELDAPAGMVRGADRDGPVFPRTTWPSLGAAYLASLGIAGALLSRERTGRGQRVETSLLQGALAAVALNWQRVEHPEETLYWMWPVDSRSIEGLFECADGRWVHHWVVRPEWATSAAAGDELTAVPLKAADRLGMEIGDLMVGNLLYPDLREAFLKFPSADWIRVGEESGVGVALVRSPTEALSDPSFIADGCVVTVEDALEGRIRHVGPVLEFPAYPGRVQGPMADVGQHTADVVAEALADSKPAATIEKPAASGSERGPLDGIRVLDFGLGVAGPFGPKLLADLGADVIKVNAMYDSFWTGTHMGLGTNRGKRSIAIDLKSPAGRAVLDRLLATTDVVATNWRPGAAARLGLAYHQLHERFPRMVVCNSRGYEKGPRSDLPGTDQTAAALTGQEYADGAMSHGNPPLWSRSGMGDTGNAFLSAIAIVHALAHRERTGEGIEVSTSIVNADLLATSWAWIHEDGTLGEVAEVDAGQYGLGPGYRLYEAADQWLFLACTTAAEWATTQRLLLGAEQPDGSGDGAAKLLEQEIAGRRAADVFNLLDGAGVPVEVVNESFCREVFDDPELLERGWISRTWAGGVGVFEDPGLLVQLSDNPCAVLRGPSRCGQHTREIMLELGYTGAEIDDSVSAKSVLDLPVHAG